MTYDPDNPLELLDDEPPRANAALTDYALLGDGRSLAQLAEQYRTRPTVGPAKPPTRQLSQLKTWSAAYRWVERVAAYDELRRRRLRAESDARWLARREQSRDSTWETAQQLREKIEQMLKLPVVEVERDTERQVSDDGKIIVINRTVIKPAKWSLRDMAAMADTAAKLERLAVDDMTERSLLQIDNLTPRDLERMSTDELVALRAQLEQRR